MLEGVFVHPYIDTEIEEPEMKLLVQKMIESEMESKRDNDTPGFHRMDKAESFEYQSTCLESEYEDLGNQQAILNLLLTKDEEIWETEIQKLTALVAAKREENDLLVQEIEQICREREHMQATEKLRLQRLTEKEKMLIDSITKLRRESN